MVLRARLAGTPHVMSLKPQGLTLAVGDDVVIAWDRGGRLYSATLCGSTWRRGLSGTMLRKRGGPGWRDRAYPTVAEADAVTARAAALASATADALTGPDWRWETTPDAGTLSDVHSLLAACARFDARAARCDAVAFATVYDAVGILPPDQYLSLVVQLTRGCAFNTCTFCGLYRDDYAVKTPDAFAEHVDAVLRHLGASASLRSRGIFLGAANALAVPMAHLVPAFDVLATRLDARHPGVCAFVDGFTGRLKTVEDYETLGAMGLRRVYVGLESGHDPLLRAVQKPGSSAHAVDTVRRVKAAGLQVGVIVMTGLGGTMYARGHEIDTALVLSDMRLGSGDLLYFSELVEPAAGPLALDTALTSHGVLDSYACRRQREAIIGATRFGAGRPQVSTYDIREFVY
jgi:hypothetical protein